MTDIETAYQQALDYLYSFVDYSLTRNLRYSPEKFDLSRMAAFMDKLGNPQNTYPIVHVAGTKGKGSTSAMIASVLQSAGYKVGFYTSPHLEDFTERIQVNRVDIPHKDLVEIVEEFKPFVDQIERLTTFELTTAIAMIYFQKQNVDVAVFEVGLGGRLDATNIVHPVVSVITSLSLDHMNVLGDTLALIAGEKAGIIKPNVPVVTSPQKKEAYLVLEQIAKERQSLLTTVGDQVRYAPWNHSLDGQTIILWDKEEQTLADQFIESRGTSEWQPQKIQIPLLGYHQIENAATAYAAIEVLRGNGFVISADAILNGFASVEWPGRFEILSRSPLLVVDSAHNRDSALKVRLAIEDYLPGKSIILLFGASEDKDIEGMFSELMPRVREVIATQSIHPRALDPHKIVELAHQFGVPAKVVLPVELALKKALELTDANSAVVVTGSLFIAAAVRQAYRSIQSSS